MRCQFSVVAALAVLVWTTPQCHADARIDRGSDVSLGLEAEVEFKQIDSDLPVTLTSPSPQEAAKPSEALTGVYVNILNDPSLLSANPADRQATAQVQVPHSVITGSTWAKGSVGGVWATRKPDPTLLSNSGRGISATAQESFGREHRSGASQNLAGPPSGNVGGIGYAAVSAGDNLGTGSDADPSDALTENTDLSASPEAGSLDLRHPDQTVSSQHGSGTEASYLPAVTDNLKLGTLSLLGLAAAPLVALLRRRRAA